MNRLSLIVCVALASVALLATACGGDDDDAGDDAAGNGDATAASTQTTEATQAATTAATAASDGNGGDLGDLFQMSGTGVLALTVNGESYEYDVTCEAARSRTFSDEPQWDYTFEAADSALNVRGTYQLVGDEETFKSLTVIDGDLILSIGEFQDVVSGGTEWAASFSTIGPTGEVEGSFETSCS